MAVPSNEVHFRADHLSAVLKLKEDGDIREKFVAFQAALRSTAPANPFSWRPVLANLAISVALVPVGDARRRVGWVSDQECTPDGLLQKLKAVELHWPYGRAIDVDWRRCALSQLF